MAYIIFHYLFLYWLNFISDWFQYFPALSSISTIPKDKIAFTISLRVAECKIITERTQALESRRRDAITNKKDKLQQKLALEVCILSFLHVCIRSLRLWFFSLFPSINVLLVVFIHFLRLMFLGSNFMK